MGVRRQCAEEAPAVSQIPGDVERRAVWSLTLVMMGELSSGPILLTFLAALGRHSTEPTKCRYLDTDML